MIRKIIIFTGLVSMMGCCFLNVMVLASCIETNTRKKEIGTMPQGEFVALLEELRIIQNKESYTTTYFFKVQENDGYYFKICNEEIFIRDFESPRCFGNSADSIPETTSKLSELLLCQTAQEGHDPPEYFSLKTA